MKVVFLGATKGMGRALARQMAARGDALALLGRDLEELSRSACDLRARGGATVATVHCDLLVRETFAEALAAAQKALGGRFDTVVVTAGVFGTQEQLERDEALREQVLLADFVNTVHFCELARTPALAHFSIKFGNLWQSVSTWIVKVTSIPSSRSWMMRSRMISQSLLRAKLSSVMKKPRIPCSTLPRITASMSSAVRRRDLRPCTLMMVQNEH